MSGLNKVIVMGNVGNDPEIRQTSSGQSVCNFNVATNESYEDKSGQRKDRTEWHKIVVWSKLAEICAEHLKKGNQVLVEGKLQTNSWEKDGKKNYSTNIVASNVVFMSKNEKKIQSKDPFADDLPF